MKSPKTFGNHVQCMIIDEKQLVGIEQRFVQGQRLDGNGRHKPFDIGPLQFTKIHEIIGNP